MSDRAQSRSFSFTSLGNAEAVGLDHAYLSRASLTPNNQDLAEGSSAVHWGDCLRPRHFDFTEGTAVRLRITDRPDLIFHAVSVIGAGQFKEFDNSTPVTFESGGIIVTGADRVKFLPFESFQKYFVLEDGQKIDSIFQIDFQTPKK